MNQNHQRAHRLIENYLGRLQQSGKILWMTVLPYLREDLKLILYLIAQCQNVDPFGSPMISKILDHHQIMILAMIEGEAIVQYEVGHPR